MPRCELTVSKSPCGIMLVGEAPGEQEELLGRPFVGASGQELTRILADAGIDRNTCHVTNVFQDRPPENDILKWCGSKIGVGGKAYTLPPIKPGKYIEPLRLPELARLADEINRLNPTLVVALGSTAAWALLQDTRITKIRGTVAEGVLTPHKVLPTFHPAYILRTWSDRVIMIADLMKAKREATHRTIFRPERFVHVEPDLNDLFAWEKILLQAPILSIDTETRRGQITCVGFSPDISTAYVCPFHDRRKPDNNYWPTLEHELVAVSFVKRVMESSVPKLFQNGLYDIQYFLEYGIRPRNCQHDTMLMHHAIQPEMKKDLGFLGSLYTSEASWKLMRQRAQDNFKKDE